MFLVVWDGGDGNVEIFLEFRECFFIHFDVAKRGGVSLVAGGDERIGSKAVKRRKNGNEVGAESAKGREGMGGNGARIFVACMRGDDADDPPFDLGQFYLREILVHMGGEGFGQAFVPGSCNRGGAEVERVHEIIVA